MKVAIVSGSFPPQPCGVGDYTERLARELEHAGVTAEVITTRSDLRTPNPYVRFELDDWRLSNWRRAVRWISDQGYDVVHLQYPAKFYGYRPGLAFLTSVLRHSLPRMPIIVTIHEFRITHLLRKLSVASLVARCDAIIVTAESERVVYERWMPWLRDKMHVVPLATTIPTIPMSPGEREKIRGRYGIRNEDVLVGYFGFLHPNKGIKRLLESFAIEHASFPDSKLMMMSLYDPSSNNYHAALEQLLVGLNLKEAVVWTGFLSPMELSRHLGSLDVAVFPFADGVSLRRLSFITALSHGIPTVTTAGQADARELQLRDGENVLLVAAGGSAQSLADSVSRLIESRPLRLRLADEGRRWAEPYQWSTVVQKTVELYHTIQKGH